jgi:hypothetical protein
MPIAWDSEICWKIFKATAGLFSDCIDIAPATDAACPVEFTSKDHVSTTDLPKELEHNKIG